MAQTNPKQCSNQTFCAEDSHSRSSYASSNSNPRNMTIDVINDSSQVSAPLFHANNNLPPHTGHRRSNSDVPLGFSAMIQSSPQLVPISSPGSSARATRKNLGNDRASNSSIVGVVGIKTEGDVANEMLDSFMNMDRVYSFNDQVAIVGGTKTNGVDTSNAESKERSAAESIRPQFQHNRSLSMDSSIGHFQFNGSSTMATGHLSRSNSLSENLAKINLGFGSGEFNEFELKKIMSDERLAEIVTSDPKRVKRILANRQSAARSKERKLRYISELEHKVRTLQTEATTLSTQITILQKDNFDLASQNNELKLRVQSMQQQAQLRDALHDALTAEVEHLKRGNMEYGEDGVKVKANGNHIL